MVPPFKETPIKLQTVSKKKSPQKSWVRKNVAYTIIFSRNESFQKLDLYSFILEGFETLPKTQWVHEIVWCPVTLKLLRIRHRYRDLTCKKNTLGSTSPDQDDPGCWQGNHQATHETCLGLGDPKLNLQDVMLKPTREESWVAGYCRSKGPIFLVAEGHQKKHHIQLQKKTLRFPRELAANFPFTCCI